MQDKKNWSFWVGLIFGQTINIKKKGIMTNLMQKGGWKAAFFSRSEDVGSDNR